MATLRSELTELTSAFDEINLEYAVCGALALAIHGFVRATLNLNLLIHHDSIRAVNKIAELQGYISRDVNILAKDEIEIHRLSKTDSDGEILPLELILLAPVLLNIWDNRETIEYEGKLLTVVSRNGLIEMKRLAGRPQDLVDIERLETEESSGKTISNRLSQIDQLRNLSLALLKAKKMAAY